MPKIGIDPGHGGSSTGTYSCNTTKDRLFEEHYALELSLMVEERLLHNSFETFLTRRTDVNPGNVSQRAQMCVDAGCDFALSIHFNGFDNESANGTEVFVPYAETGAGIEAGFYKYVGPYFKIRAPYARSSNINNRNETFDKKLDVEARKFKAATTSKRDYFGFIRAAWAKGLSADLIEICFLTNRKDFETYVKNKEAIADGIARSIVEGYRKVYKPLDEKKELFGVKVEPFGTEPEAVTLANRLNSQGYNAVTYK